MLVGARTGCRKRRQCSKLLSRGRGLVRVGGGHQKLGYEMTLKGSPAIHASMFCTASLK
jgi:hypothetical protein